MTLAATLAAIGCNLLLQVAGAGPHVRPPCAQRININKAYPLINSMETREEALLPAKYLGHWPGADQDSLFG